MYNCWKNQVAISCSNFSSIKSIQKRIRDNSNQISMEILVLVSNLLNTTNNFELYSANWLHRELFYWCLLLVNNKPYNYLLYTTKHHHNYIWPPIFRYCKQVKFLEKPWISAHLYKSNVSFHQRILPICNSNIDQHF